MWVHDLAAADASCGGKALGLARLIRAQLPVPRGFVIDEHAFRDVAGALDVTHGEVGHVLAEAAQRIRSAELPEDFVREVDRRAAELGTVVVRSSATIEDGQAGAAAGVFSSSGAVSPAELWQAIRAVWLSALTPIAATYARRRGGRISIGVIVQAFAPGELVTIYTRPPGAPTADELLVQHGTSLLRLRRPVGRTPERSLADTAERPATKERPFDLESIRTLFEPATEKAAPHEQTSGSAELPENRTLVRTKFEPVPDVETAAHRGITGTGFEEITAVALRAEGAIGPHGGTDVEIIVASSGELSIVQARPIVHPAKTTRVPVPAPVLGALIADGRRWTWDVTHNPDPLSTAQAELVELVDRAGIGPSMRVCAGYLYTAARSAALAPELPDLTDREAVLARVADLEARLAAVLEGQSGRGVGAMPPPVKLHEALERYVAAIAIWANELSPLVRALPRSRAVHRPSAVEATLAAAARGEIPEDEALARIGVMSPAWDVAVPTYAERPELIRAAIARARESVASASSQTTASTLPPAGVDELAADLAERDDVWFAKAQWLVRRALLARADELGVDREDACWLRFDVLARGIDREDAKRQAAGARAANERAARWDMPLVVPAEPAPECATRDAATLRGVGTGPRVTGRVVRYASLGSAISVSRGDVVVARAVTPALAVLVIGCTALVSETGGLLDHGAALARELGVPCVVGCGDAWSRLADGMLVTVDGDGGSVEIVETNED
ncbi:MAG TPA: PEP/pyruvate-binding domain-containing protein [Kofleriaceae bacterium]|nr:PEP/pyruvate-binding domain-containing protein [Kofleriaceae bacterium]